jgi:hypothetical protein
MKFDILSRKKFKCTICDEKFKTRTDRAQAYEVSIAHIFASAIALVFKGFVSKGSAEIIRWGSNPQKQNWAYTGHSTKLYPDNCRPTNPGGWFHYNNTWG